MERYHTAYMTKLGRWQGCDWETHFGEARLNLNGLRAAQAEVIARATAGAEAECWRQAARWLRQVEQDTQRAEREAQSAVEAAVRGDWANARRHADAACAVETAYPEHAPIWSSLRLAIILDGRGPSGGARCRMSPMPL